MSTQDTFTLADPKVMSSPFAYYEWMQAEDPVHFDEQAGAYFITRYEDIREALKRTDVFSSELGFSGVRRPEFQDDVDEFMREEGFGPFVLNFTVDPPEHGRRRPLIDQAFNAHRVAAMEDYMSQIVTDLVNAFADKGEAELVEALAIPIPIHVIADQLGVTRDNLDVFKQWSDAAVANAFNPMFTRGKAMENARLLVDMQNFLYGVIEDRRKDPKDDMISALAHARMENEHGEAKPLSIELLLSICQALLVAGNETTTNGIGFGLLYLAEDADLFRRLVESQDQDRDLRHFCEEVLRLQSPVPQLPRMTREDITIGGEAIPKGSPVYLCYAAANRDENKFDGADEFDAGRQNVGQHLAFGGGIHRCVGAMLARMEMKCAFREIINRFDNFRLAVACGDLVVNSLFVTRGLASLPVKFDRRAAG